MSSNISGTLMPSVVASARKAARLAWLEVMSATRPAPSSAPRLARLRACPARSGAVVKMFSRC